MSTLTINTQDGVLCAEIAAPPLNLLGPELVHDLVALIQDADADHDPPPRSTADLTGDAP